MKTNELIAQLQKLDPSGEIEVVGTTGDIFFAEKLPAYYDGYPHILIRDESRKNFYNIIGMKQLKLGDKIILHEIGMEELMWDHHDNDGLILEGDEEFMRCAAKYKKEIKNLIAND